MAFLILNYRKVYWQDAVEPTQSTVLNAFQFGAKLHELLTDASLAALVLHRVRWNLIHDKGVPLGYLTSAYQLSITCLFSLQFWGPLKPLRIKKLWLTLLILLTIILTTVIGPSSAILVIPSLD